MIRISFKPEFEACILSGDKTVTRRWKPLRGVTVGSIVAAVTGKDGKPAFLTPAADRFATLKILNITRQNIHTGISQSDALQSGFYSALAATAFYSLNKPPGVQGDEIWHYKFEVVKP